MTDAELDILRGRLSSRKYYDRMTLAEADQLARDINAVLAEVDRLRAYQRLPKGTLGLPHECTDPKEYD